MPSSRAPTSAGPSSRAPTLARPAPGRQPQRAQLQGADLRETTIWRARVDDALWDLADLRGSTVQPMTNSEIDALISEATKGIPDEEARTATAERLTAALRTEERSRRPEFPGGMAIGAERDVLGLAIPSPSRSTGAGPSGPRNRPTMTDLATFLGDLACGRDVPEAQTRGLARRALSTALGEPRPPWPGSSPRASSAPTARRPRGCPRTCAASWNSSRLGATRRPHRRDLRARSRRVTAL